MSRSVFLGVDGGATKTEVALVAPDGTFLTRIQGGPTALDFRPTKVQIENLTGLLDHVLSEIGAAREDILFAGFGVHGVDYACELRQQRRSLFRPLGIPEERAVLVNDGIVALWGGTPARRAVVLQLGTGFTAAYRREYGEERHFDPFNAGLGINLREQIAVTAFRSLDGRAGRSILPELLFDHFGIHDMETLLYQWKRGRIPILAQITIISVLTEAVERGDRVAIQLTRRAARIYAHDVLAMIRHVGGREPVDVVLGGGVLIHGPGLLRRTIGEIVRKKRPNAAVHAPILSPALGGAVLAAFHAGKDPAAIFRRAMETDGQAQEAAFY